MSTSEVDGFDTSVLRGSGAFALSWYVVRHWSGGYALSLNSSNSTKMSWSISARYLICLPENEEKNTSMRHASSYPDWASIIWRIFSTIINIATTNL